MAYLNLYTGEINTILRHILKLKRTSLIRRMFVYKFGSSDLVTKESKIKGKKGTLKTRANIWDISFKQFVLIIFILIFKGHAVAQLVEALRYKSEGRVFDSRWCHWNFSLT